MKTETKRRWSQAGALTTAGTAAATIFCCLPFASGIIGAGVAAMGARFAPYRSYLELASVGLLGYAFYQVYRPAAAACDDASCDSPVTLARRRVILWCIAIAVAAFLSAPWWANWVIYWTR